MEPQGGRKPSSHEARFDLKFLKRFLKICKLLFPSLKSPASLLTFLLLLLCLLEQVVIFNIGLIPSKFLKALNDKSEEEFRTELIRSLVLVLTEALILSLKTYVSSVIYITWRRSLCRKLHDLYYTDILYYRLNVVDKSIDNPDQRITQDVDRMCSTFSKVLIPLLIAPFTTGYYLYQCIEASGYVGIVSCIVTFVFFTILNKLLMTPVAKYFYKQEKMEGDFRYKHMQIRTYSESAAFYRAGNVEKSKTNKKLDTLLSTQHRLVRWELLLNCCINTADYIGSILSYIAISVPIFLGSYDDLTPGELSALISKNSFVTMYLINCFTKLIDQAIEVTDVVGAGHRIGQLFEELYRLRTEQSEDPNFNGWNDVGLSQVQPDSKILSQFNSMSYGPPKSSKVLCRDLNFNVEQGTSILVTGESGCGKTSLFRVMFGLWSPKSGNIKDYICIGSTDILCLPQKPYFTDGTLRDQVIYPLQEHEIIPDDVKIYRYLELVGLNDLLNRLGGLDVDAGWNWYDEMSPGEMQRLSFVRLFFHEPKVAVLDEATSQVSQTMEELLYKTCRDLQMTVLSIGHRSTVRQFHEMELTIGPGEAWSLQPINELYLNNSDPMNLLDINNSDSLESSS